MNNTTATRVEVCNGATACGNFTTVQKGTATQVCKNTEDQHYRVWHGSQPSEWKAMGDRCLVFDNRKCFDVYTCSKDESEQCPATITPKHTTAQSQKRTNVPMAPAAPTTAAAAAATTTMMAAGATTDGTNSEPQMFVASKSVNLKSTGCSSCM